MKMGVGIKKYGVRTLFVLLGIVGMAFIANSKISHQENASIVAACSPGGCPDSGLDGSSTPKPKGPKCPCLTPRLPKG
jgi:hypothetical protein